MNGAPFGAKRCFAFGYFLPVNSKNALPVAAVAAAEMSSLRSKVEHRTRLAAWGKAEFHLCLFHDTVSSCADNRSWRTWLSSSGSGRMEKARLPKVTVAFPASMPTTAFRVHEMQLMLF
ncbi:hypothetical protein [Rhizobium mongolense]|uniref:hypothetical protein n=1 Tax=Rhizobium mongolense TaxID=57676 RepID=UPI0035E417C8